LEGKNADLEHVAVSQEGQASSDQVKDWEREKEVLQNLVQKNQEMSEDLEAKLK